LAFDNFQTVWELLSELWWIPLLYTVWLLLTGKPTLRDIAQGNFYRSRSKDRISERKDGV